MVLQSALGAAMNTNINWHLPLLVLKISLGVKRLRLTAKLREIGPGEQRDTVLLLRAFAPAVYSPNTENAAAAGLARVKGW